MGPKAKQGKFDLKVAKRDSKKTQDDVKIASKSSDASNANSAGVVLAQNEPIPDDKPEAGDKPETVKDRQASGVNPRKVSEGLKQLPPAAYQFVRESYLMLDSDGSGGISCETLKEMLASLGMRDVSERKIDEMLAKTGEPITFAGYLAVMGELLGDLPAREELDLMLEAFQRKDGSFDERSMREGLKAEGLTQEEIDSVMKKFSKPTRRGDEFDPKAFASTMSI